ncbi:PREDICTED: endothelial lipase-like isoform X2 [Nicrophorus vespilloides]|uniref:Endothelial lipase-like isoform X2 n=1 Tax=Nicrophorus vespilloides TaxID=110193 RepID=A0ABM1MS22_NICVS|nr:PREDICTED: endothelial lipase-like isoform X2 [Nicrophorus vespilloides]
MNYIRLFLLIGVCTGTMDEIKEKLLTQLRSFYDFALGTEIDYQSNMHLVVTYFLHVDNSNKHKLDEFYGVRETVYNKSIPTILIIHGYTDSKEREVFKHLRQMFAANVEANLIVVDWSRAAKQIYFTAMSNTYQVGKEIARFLLDLDTDLSMVHLIGHSLGAHVAGIAGDCLDGKIGRITGLDPAGPGYEFLGEVNNSLSLDSGDANFVDVIHTASWFFGVLKPIGHADFYPNGGAIPQPGCDNIIVTEVWKTTTY